MPHKDAAARRAYHQRYYAGNPGKWALSPDERAAKAAKRKPANPSPRALSNARIAGRRRSSSGAQLIRWAKSRPCMDCGVAYPAYVMDLDHRPGADKLGDVGLMNSRALSVLVAEIAKCDAVCSNCHRERTFSRIRADKQKAS